MGVSPTWFTISFLLCFLTDHSLALRYARPVPHWFEENLPEIDGFPVEDTCNVFIISPPELITRPPKATTSNTMTKQIPTTTTHKRLAVQMPQKKEQGKNSGAPMSNRPVVSSTAHPALSLLQRLLANNRGHALRFNHNSLSNRVRSAGKWKKASHSSEDSSDES